MIKEIKNLFSKKYVFITLCILLAITIFCWCIEVQPEDYRDDSLYSNFIDEIDIYDTQEDLNELYQKYKSVDVETGIVSADNLAKYKSLLYGFSVKEHLKYDSLVKFEEELKYTQFHYLSSFKFPIMLFILLASLIIGGFYQTSDVANKMSKLIYTSGEKRHKIIDTKYCVSILILIAFVIIFESIVALLGLIYCDSGAKYCVVYTGGNSLHILNYFQYFCLFLTSHIVALIISYTFVYYLSVICKNGIIPVCTIFSILLVSTFLQTKLPDSLFYNMLTRSGFIEVLFKRDVSQSVDLYNLCLYIPIALISIIPFIISRFTIKRTDYSR